MLNIVLIVYATSYIFMFIWSHFLITSCVLEFSYTVVFFVYSYADHRDLHVLTHSFPTRRSSDLRRSRPRRHSPGSGRIQRRAAPSAWRLACGAASPDRSEEHTSELQSLMRISYAVFCLKKKKEQDKTEK